MVNSIYLNCNPVLFVLFSQNKLSDEVFQKAVM